MRIKFFLSVAFISILTGCTSLNDKCNYLPPGDCWSDVRHHCTWNYCPSCYKCAARNVNLRGEG